MSIGSSVRIFEIQADGKIEPLMGSDVGFFGGSCPNVGDTFGKVNVLDDTFSFYSVQRRVFVDSCDGDEGWAVIVRPIEESALLNEVMTTWIEDTKFWRAVDIQETRESSEETRKQIQELMLKSKESKKSTKPKARKKPDPKRRKVKKEDKRPPTAAGETERDKHKPLLGLSAKEEKVLRYMVEHSDCTTPDVIPNAGEHTMERLTEKGALKEIGRDFRDEREWAVTDEGHAEIKRTDTWRNWKS